MKKVFFTTSRLHKDEFTNLIIDTVGIIKKYDPDNIGVKPFYDILLEQQALLKLISNYESKHPLSETIKMQRKQLSNLVSSLKQQIASHEKSNLKLMQDNLLIVKPFVEKYFKSVETKTIKALEGKVNDFLDAYQQSEVLVQAATGINVNSFIDEMKLMYINLKLNTDTRKSDKAKDADLRNKNAVSNVLDALNNLVKAIELASVHNSSYNYDSLIAELNKMFSEYNALSRSRKTKSAKNAVIKKESADTSSQTTSAEI